MRWWSERSRQQALDGFGKDLPPEGFFYCRERTGRSRGSTGFIAEREQNDGEVRLAFADPDGKIEARGIGHLLFQHHEGDARRVPG